MSKAFNLHLIAQTSEPDWAPKLRAALSDLKGCEIQSVVGKLHVQARLVIKNGTGPHGAAIRSTAEDVAWAVGMLVRRNPSGLTLLYTSAA